MKRASVELPQELITYVMTHLDLFSVSLEDGRIILAPRNGNDAIRQAETKPRPKFVYRVVDKKRTPTQAEGFGFSPQRLAVYRAIWESAHGLQSKDILERTKLPHGSVQQILHWLRRQKMITGEAAS